MQTWARYSLLHMWVFTTSNQQQKNCIWWKVYWYFFNSTLSKLGLYNNNLLKFNYKLAFLIFSERWTVWSETERVARRTAQRKILCAFYLHWSHIRPEDLMMRASGQFFPLGEDKYWVKSILPPDDWTTWALRGQ